VEKSIDFGPTKMGEPVDARTQYAQYVRDMQASMGVPSGATKAPTKPLIVTVSCTLKAEWPLTAGSDDELFIAGYALQEKIKSAGIGKKDLKKLTPEELEAAEEAHGTKSGAGEPRLQYVCKISHADRDAAQAEAFQKARQDAADLAKAAGTELAALRHLSSVQSSPTAVEDADQLFSRAMMQQMTGVPLRTMRKGQMMRPALRRRVRWSCKLR